MKKFLLLSLFLTTIVSFAQPKVVGHRGCRDVPGLFENTIASLKYAQQIGVDAVEFDLQMTADNKIIVFHGPQIPGCDKTINELTFKEARNIKLPGGFQMPTLEEYFKQAKKYPDIEIVLEFKKQSTLERNQKMVSDAMDLAEKMKIGKQIEYTTFSETICRLIKERDPQAKVIYISTGVHVKDAAYAKEQGYDGISYNLDAWMNRPEVVEQAKELGVETTLWLANHYEVIDWAVRHGIDYISTDFPKQAVDYMKSIENYNKSSK